MFYQSQIQHNYILKTHQHKYECNLFLVPKEELADLKDQVMLYEGAVDLGVISGSGVKQHSPPTPSDEDIVRNLAKEDWKTPQPAG